MTPYEFTLWIAAMISSGKARSEKDCAEALGIHPNGLLKRKKIGTDKETAYACAAILTGLAPFPATLGRN